MAKSKSKAKYQNRDVYLNAALAIVADLGVEQLTMRRMAEYLDVSAMAVYKHFANKEALLTAALDAFIARADVIPTQSLPWDRWMQDVINRMYDALSQQPSWIPKLGAITIGPNALQVTQAFIVTLTQAGFTPDQAVRIYLTAIHLLVGAATLAAALQGGNPGGPLPTNKKDNPVQQLGALAALRQIDISLPPFLDSLRLQLAQQAPESSTRQSTLQSAARPTARSTTTSTTRRSKPRRG